ncbi:hypothetical protein BH10ACT11_BH10ACT11_06320 [soil metagenome]
MKEEPEIPKGSVAAGRRVRIPRGADRTNFYVNGVLQKQGTDFKVLEGHVIFSRPILKEEKLKGIRKAVLLIGVIGNYVRDEHVDLEYRLEGETKLASDVAILPD